MKRVLLVSAVAILIPFAAIGLANRDGYCVPELRKLSPEEKLASAVEQNLNYHSGTLVFPTLPDGTSEAVYVPYTDARNFEQTNPDCCSLKPFGAEGRKTKFIESLTGQATSFAHLSYSQRHRLADGNIHKRQVHSYLPVSNCGNIR